MGDTRARVCCGTACSRVTQERAGSTDCLSEMNAALLPLEKVVTGHGGTGKWTRKKAFGFSRRVRSRPKATPMRMRYDPRKANGKGKGRNSERYGHVGKGHARMQVRRETSSCESASELLKTLTAHEEWEAVEMCYPLLVEMCYGEILACAEAGQWQRAAAVSDLMVATGLVADVERFVASIGATRKWNRAIRLLAAATATRIQAWWRAKQSDHKSIHATRIQACWRGLLGRKDFQAAKHAKAKKVRLMQLSFSERLEAAAPRDGSAGLLVVGNTILGHSIANDEPLYGGKCVCVGLLTGVVPPCFGGSVTVFHDAPEAYYYVVWDFVERYLDKACDVREMHRQGSEMVYNDISSLRQLLSLGPPYKPHGNVDLQTLLAERREPLGYTNSGQRLVHSQDLIFMVASAVFMQCDIVLLDAATAMLRNVIVRCQRPNPRRQRSCARAQLRSDDGAMGAHLSGGEGRARTESALA